VVIQVSPGYGWGWTDGLETIETPPPFEADMLVDDTLKGTVRDGGYAGWVIELTRRHTDWDGQVNISLFHPNDPKRHVHGYGSIPIESMTL
jgi:hypothetical protein